MNITTTVTAKVQGQTITVTTTTTACDSRLTDHALRVVNLQDQAIRQALINMGWTPPSDVPGLKR